jgi:regulator of replication initiation timing
MSSNQASQNANSLVERMTQAVKNAHVAIQVLKNDNEALKTENDKLRKELESLKQNLNDQLSKPLASVVVSNNERTPLVTVEKEPVRVQKTGKKAEPSR